jgi:hypothetical protein
MDDRDTWTPSVQDILELWDTAETQERQRYGTELENNIGGRTGHPHRHRAGNHAMAANRGPDSLGHDRGDGGNGNRTARGSRPQRTLGALGPEVSAT